MQDKLKEIYKKISIFTTDPDKDWRRLFTGFMCLTISVFVWSIFFYIQVRQDIIDSESIKQKSIGTTVVEREDDLRKLIVEFEAKKQKNDALINGNSMPTILDLSDPAR